MGMENNFSLDSVMPGSLTLRDYSKVCVGRKTSFFNSVSALNCGGLHAVLDSTLGHTLSARFVWSDGFNCRAGPEHWWQGARASCGPQRSRLGRRKSDIDQRRDGGRSFGSN